MSDKMKVRDGNDGYSYPYTSPDIVIDKNGKSNTKKFEEIDSQFKDIAKQVENVGQPTQEQINIAIDQAIKDGKITGSGGLNSTAKTLLETILQNAIYATDQSNNIASLVSALSSSGGDMPPTTKYTITNNLTNCTNSNSATTIEKNSSYTATISPDNEYSLHTVTVTMNTLDVTSNVYSNGQINIDSVTGDIVIVANAIKSSEKDYSDNLINFDTLINTGKMEDGTEIGDTTNLVSTDYISVDVNNPYYTNLCRYLDEDKQTTVWGQKIYEYDSSKTHIKILNLINNSTTLEERTVQPLESNCAYVKILFNPNYTVTPYFGLKS